MNCSRPFPPVPPYVREYAAESYEIKINTVLIDPTVERLNQIIGVLQDHVWHLLKIRDRIKNEN